MRKWFQLFVLLLVGVQGVVCIVLAQETFSLKYELVFVLGIVLLSCASLGGCAWVSYYLDQRRS